MRRSLFVVSLLFAACNSTQPASTTSEGAPPKAAPKHQTEVEGAPKPTEASALAADDGPQVGDEAPSFTLPSDSGQDIGLEQFRGSKAVLLAFYPKDFTGG